MVYIIEGRESMWFKCEKIYFGKKKKKRNSHEALIYYYFSYDLKHNNYQIRRT